MRVLVTGATGFVASFLVPRLVRDGHDVVAASHDSARLDLYPGSQPLLWDVGQPELRSPLLDRLDAVVHLAQANVPFPDRAREMFAVHVAGAQHLLELALRSGVHRVVFTSTGSVYGSGSRPWRETDPTNGPGYYAATKVAAERLIRAYGELVPYTIFRLFTPYGPGQTRRLIPNLIDRVRQAQPITVAGGAGPTFNPLFVTHAVDVLAQSLDAHGNELLNLGGDEALSVRDMATLIGGVLGRDPLLHDEPGAPDRVVGDISALRRAYRLPEQLTSFEDGVRAMLAA